MGTATLASGICPPSNCRRFLGARKSTCCHSKRRSSGGQYPDESPDTGIPAAYPAPNSVTLPDSRLIQNSGPGMFLRIFLLFCRRSGTAPTANRHPKSSGHLLAEDQHIAAYIDTGSRMPIKIRSCLTEILERLQVPSIAPLDPIVSARLRLPQAWSRKSPRNSAPSPQPAGQA